LYSDPVRDTVSFMYTGHCFEGFISPTQRFCCILRSSLEAVIDCILIVSTRGTIVDINYDESHTLTTIKHFMLS